MKKGKQINISLDNTYLNEERERFNPSRQQNGNLDEDYYFLLLNETFHLKYFKITGE